MKKYSTPELELEVFNTSDVITASFLTVAGANETDEIDWNDNTYWKAN